MSAPAPTPRRQLSDRARGILWFVGSALVLAAVITVFSAFSTPEPTAPTRSDPGLETVTEPGQEAYDAGLSALKSGQTTSALSQFKAAAAAGNTKAQARIDEINEAAKPPAPKPTDSALSAAVADPGTLLPATVAGYTRSRVETSALGALLALQPTKDGPAGKVTLVVMNVLDKGSSTGAKAYVDGISKAYPNDVTTVRIGSYTGRFGTDGSRLASAVFSRGRYAFEVVATSYRGAPIGIKDIAVAAASSFPAAR